MEKGKRQRAGHDGKGKGLYRPPRADYFFSIFARREPLWKSENEFISKPLREHRDPWGHN